MMYATSCDVLLLIIYFSDRSLPLLLPAVEDGIFNDNWRIRQSSVELLGDLLFKVCVAYLSTASVCCLSFNNFITELDVIYEPIYSFQVAGTSGKALLEGGSDDEGSSTEAHGRAIIEVLGHDKRNEVLAALYMVRADVSLSVRQVMNGPFFFGWVLWFIIISGICICS